jgi:hypothetical protein
VAESRISGSQRRKDLGLRFERLKPNGHAPAVRL